LFNVSLLDRLAYVALSYCWGDPTDLTTITVNGTAIQVRRNLAAALKALRSHRQLVLWADALCIDQFNWTERGRQILRMREIYSRADATIVWLGPDKDHIAKDAFAFFHLLLATKSPTVDFDNAIGRAPENLTTLSGQPAGCLGWTYLGAFTELLYWTRTWIIQEW
jgi:hypothetical protein